jgi:hypothetical protein
MPYITVFEITQKPFQWWFPAFGLIFVLMGAVSVWIGRRWPSQKLMKITGYFGLVFASLWVLLAFGSTFSEYRQCVDAYRSGNYAVVEGQVENFRPMPYEGHQDECFSVRNKRFCYSDYGIQAGFNQSASHGGPVREGLPVRIAYSNDQILRLQIRADSLPSPEERSAYASKAEAKWNQWTKTDPGLDHMELGFSFAAFLIVLCWNLDWRHYIRYWLRRQLPHMRYWEIGFRAFFAACLMGSAIHLVQEIVGRQRTIGDYGQAGLDSLIWIGFFVVVDIFFRWRMRKASSGSTPRPTGNA